MHIFINRGFEERLSRVIILKNHKKTATLNFTNEYYSLDANHGDYISVSYKNISNLTLRLADFYYTEDIKSIYIYPTALCKIWELLNYRILPYLCLILFAFKAVFESTFYIWGATIMIVITALSLITLQTLIYIPNTRKRLFSIAYSRKIQEDN